MKKWVNWLTSVLILISINIAYGDSNMGIESIKAYAKAQITIEQLRKQKEVNWSQITKQYEITAPIVKEIESKYGMNYDTEIREALKNCEANENSKVNQQIIAKGLQHISVMAIQDELKKVEKSHDASQKIAAFFEGIRPTFARRDSDFFKDKKNLEASAEQAIKILLNKDTKNYLTARMELESVLTRTYALSVLFEVLEIESLRDSKISDCDVKRMEALVFYRVIQAKIKKRSPSSDELISNMLNRSYETMNAKILEENLNLGLSGIKLR
ncbi:MAG: hypothetical protein HQK76_00120 [Desulfobacterales bacterium]|nr:hypothetical protein [Desulfobacterales bacterium]